MECKYKYKWFYTSRFFLQMSPTPPPPADVYALTVRDNAHGGLDIRPEYVVRYHDMSTPWGYLYGRVAVRCGHCNHLSVNHNWDFHILEEGIPICGRCHQDMKWAEDRRNGRPLPMF